jgi:hypothetical protein
MTAQQAAKVDDLQPLLSPILTLASPEKETRMGRTVGEALALPDAGAVRQRALPRETVAPLLEETVEWVRQVVRSVWLPADLPDRIYAVPRALEGEDAFIGAWKSMGQPFQLAVTRERVHLLTRMSGSGADKDDAPKGRGALLQAYEFLRIPEKLDPSNWKVQPFGGLVLGTRAADDMARDWHETLLFLTDGSGVKYSALKYRGRTSPAMRGGPRQAPTPWFPREAGKK